jgi:hypothetical protein
MVFTWEYVLGAYSAGEDPKFAGANGLRRYLTTLAALIDFCSIAPYYVSFAFDNNATATMFLRSLRLIRIVRTDRFKSAFNILKNVISAQADILIVMGFTALVFWIFFASIMYYTERANPDKEMAAYYRTIPQAMWITLLNLSGECPLVMYTDLGKVFIGIIGIFAVGFVSIPIGVLSAGFQDYVDENTNEEPDQDPPDETSADMLHARSQDLLREGERIPRLQFYDKIEDAAVRAFLDGETTSGMYFELLILLFIFVSVGLAIVQTVPGQKCEGADKGGSFCPVYSALEVVCVLFFTLEYVLRLYAASSKCHFIFSFYSLIDLVAITPFYLASLYPNSWIDQHNELFLMLRILRLVKLDKFCPSLTLIDDVFRLKWNQLLVSGSIAAILLIVFNSLMFLAENDDVSNMIDPIPQQACSENCTQSMRYSSAFASLPFVMIHLTGDYPIVEYNSWGRVMCFFMVIFAAGIVAIPTGIIADGFVEVVKKRMGDASGLRDYDVKFRQIGDVPPREFRSNQIDRLQTSANAFLNGTKTSDGELKRSFWSNVFNKTILVLIVMNVIAILLETMPSTQQSTRVWFDVFETIVILFFTVEYILRMFSVTKDKIHLYSRWCYATTFFGLVDLITILPFYIELVMKRFGLANGNSSDIFRLIRLFRLLELEHFVTAFTLLDNVFWRSRGTLLATGILAFSVWVSAAALFYMFEQNNPNFCTEWVETACAESWKPTCTCAATSTFDTMPHALFYVAIILAGEWPIVDLTVAGKFLCIALCIIGIALAALPVGILFDSFGSVLEDGLSALDEEEGDNKEAADGTPPPTGPTESFTPPVERAPSAGSWRPLSWNPSAAPAFRP